MLSPPYSKDDQKNMHLQCISVCVCEGGILARWNETILVNLKGLNTFNTNKQDI